MNQLLDRLIPSDDSHTVINQGRLYSIEVIENNLMTFRVPCKQANSPAKFMVSFNDHQPEVTDEEGKVVPNTPIVKKKKRNRAYIPKDLRIFVS